MVFKVARIMLSPLRPLFGSGIGNVKILKWAFTRCIDIMPQRYLVVELDGCKLGMTIGKGRGFDSMASGLLLGKGYEVGTTKVFEKMVKPDMKVVDVGAHIGYYTVLASKLVGAKGQVWACEPEPKNYEELLRNLTLNQSKNVIAIPRAIAECHKEASLFVSNQWSGECSLLKIEQRPKDCIAVNVVALDEIVNEPIDILKIDIDGGEANALKGASQLIQRSPHIKVFMECWKYGIEAAGQSYEDYWLMLESYGFRYIYQIGEKKGEIKRLSMGDMIRALHIKDGMNVLCSKEAVDNGYTVNTL